MSQEIKHAWVNQIGPAYTRDAVADLLGTTAQAVARRQGLLELEQSNGHIVYPVFQFKGRTLLAGVAVVVSILGDVVQTPWTTASFLTSPQTDLGGRTPIEALRDSDIDDVVLIAHRAANALGDGRTRADLST